MTAATQDLDTPRREGERITLPVAGSVKIFANSLIAMNASGYARPARGTATDKIIGRAVKYIDNTSGTNGYDQYGVPLTLDIDLGIFRWVNGDSITLAANRGQIVYAVDDQTVALTSNGGVRPAAGRVVDVDSFGVWVATGDEAEGVLDVYAEAFTPEFTAGTNTTAGASLVGWYIRIGKVVKFDVRGSISHTAGAPTASTFELSLPIASDLSAAGDLGGVVTGANVTVGHLTAQTTNNTMQFNYSIGGTGAQAVSASGSYTIK